MKTCSKSPLMLLKWMYITLLTVLEAQKVKVEPKVTGYLGHDVTLPCQFSPGSEDGNVTQVQWDVEPPGKEKFIIIVYNCQHGISVHNSSLKERVKIVDQSLTIRDVQMRDAGLYTCSIATFPSGSFDGTTNFVVQEQMPLSSGVVSAIVVAVLLLLVIMSAIGYFIFIRRPSPIRHRVYVDTCDPLMDVSRTSVIVRGEDVVYTDVKLKPSRDARCSFNDKRTEHAYTDDVTYSEVLISRQQPK